MGTVKDVIIENFVACVDVAKETGEYALSSTLLNGIRLTSSILIKGAFTDDDDNDCLTIVYDGGVIVMDNWDGLDMDDYGVIFTFHFPTGLIQTFDFTQADKLL